MKRMIALFMFAMFAVCTAAVAGTGAEASMLDTGLLEFGMLTIGAMATIDLKNLPHLDDDQSVFFARELEFVKSRSYDKKYAELKARTLIPVSSEAEPWADA